MIKTLILDDNFQYIKTIVNTVISKIDEIQTTYICTTVKEALNILENNIINLVLLDLRLPDSTGIEVINKINQYNNIKKPNIIIISEDYELINNVKNNYEYYNVISKGEKQQEIYKKILDAVKSLKYEEYKKEIKEKIYKEMTSIGYNFKYKGSMYLVEAITYIYESNNLELLDNLEKNVYNVIAFKYNKSINNIKTNIIKATNSINNKQDSMYITPKVVISNIIISIINEFG